MIIIAINRKLIWTNTVPCSCCSFWCFICFRFHSDHWFAGILLMKSFAPFLSHNLCLTRLRNSIPFFICVWDSLQTSSFYELGSGWISFAVHCVSSRVILDKCPMPGGSVSQFFGLSTFVHEILFEAYAQIFMPLPVELLDPNMYNVEPNCHTISSNYSISSLFTWNENGK